MYNSWPNSQRNVPSLTHKPNNHAQEYIGLGIGYIVQENETEFPI